MHNIHLDRLVNCRQDLIPQNNQHYHRHSIATVLHVSSWIQTRAWLNFLYASVERCSSSFSVYSSDLLYNYHMLLSMSQTKWDKNLHKDKVFVRTRYVCCVAITTVFERRKKGHTEWMDEHVRKKFYTRQYQFH